MTLTDEQITLALRAGAELIVDLKTGERTLSFDRDKVDHSVFMLLENAVLGPDQAVDAAAEPAA